MISFLKSRRFGILLILFFLPVTLAMGPKRQPSPPEKPSDPFYDGLHVGFSRVEVPIPIGVPLAGYGGGARRTVPDFFGKHPYAYYMTPSEGQHDPIQIRTMVVRYGRKKLLFMAVDLVGVTASMREDLLKRTSKQFGFHSQEVFVGASHTHSGPGTLTKNLMWQLITMDRYKEEVYETFLNQMILSIRIAMTSLHRAELWQSRFQAKELTKNRRIDDGPVDSRVQILYARSLEEDSKGAWLGGILNFAIHGTALGASNLHFSADVPGAISGSLEANLQRENTSSSFENDPSPVMLFFNGAEGDVAPSHGDLDGMAEIGESLATLAESKRPRAKPMSPNWSVRSQKVWLGLPHFSLSGCLAEKDSWLKFFSFIKIALPFWMSWSTQLWALEWGPLLWMTWPGEPTTSLGFKLKRIAKNAGFEYPSVLGLTNDHLAYFTSEEEFKTGGYEACSSLYGKRGGQKILKGYEELLAW